MPVSDPPDPDKTKPDDGPADNNRELISATMPILGKIHARVSASLPEMSDETSIQDLVKSIFDGALYAHDRTRTQDWPKLEAQLEDMAIDTVLALILLKRRHNRAGGATP